MFRFLFLGCLLMFAMPSWAQDETAARAGLLLERCSYEPDAEAMVLHDDAELALNNDYSLRLERKIVSRGQVDAGIGRVPLHSVDRAAQGR